MTHPFMTNWFIVWRKQDALCQNPANQQPIFRQLILIDLYNTFQSLLSKIRIPTEGGSEAEVEVLDALMQAVACSDAGWRQGARHFLVLSTSSASDFVGGESAAELERPPYGVQCLPAFGDFYDLRAAGEHYTLPMVNYKAKHKAVEIVVALPPRIYRTHKVLDQSAHVEEIVKVN